NYRAEDILRLPLRLRRHTKKRMRHEVIETERLHLDTGYANAFQDLLESRRRVNWVFLKAFRLEKPFDGIQPDAGCMLELVLPRRPRKNLKAPRILRREAPLHNSNRNGCHARSFL